MLGVARIVLVLIAIAGSAHAEDAPWAVGVTDEQKRVANTLLADGNTLFVAEKYADALAKYTEATRSWDHPAIRFNMVRCLIQLGRTLDASDEMERALRYGAKPLEDNVYTEALGYQKLLANQVGTVELVCTQPKVVLRLDTEVVGECPRTVPKRLLVGRHQVLGTVDGFEPRAIEVVVSPGLAQRIEVKLEPVKRSGVGPRFYGKLAVASGAGLIAIAGGLGGWAWHRYRAQFPDHCTEVAGQSQPSCDASGSRAIDRSRLFGNTATVSGVIGLATLAIGVVVLWRSPMTERKRTEVIAGPRSVTVRTRF